jgi:outer membrane protein assembly factor BamD (BamD/ComL family)
MIYRRLLDQPQTSPIAAGWLRYQLADALRLNREFAAAYREIDRIRTDSLAEPDDELQERVDLLAVELALDRGDCQQAIAELEGFLSRHPTSKKSRSARRRLQYLETEGSQCT